MLNYKIKIFLLLIQTIIVCVLTINAQFSPYIHYDTHNGLPQIQVQELLQDKKGFIWIGTKGGLAKFNGEKFDCFLSNKYVRALKMTKSGQIYIKSDDSLYWYNKGKIESISLDLDITKFNLETLDTSVCLFNSVSIIFLDKNNTISNSINIKEKLNTTIYNLAFDEIENKIYIVLTNKEVLSFSNMKLKHERTFKKCITLQKFGNGQLYYEINNGRYEIAYDLRSDREFFRYVFNGKMQDSLKVSFLPVKYYITPYFGDHFLLDSATLTAKKLTFPFIKYLYPVILDFDNNLWVGADKGLFQINRNVVEVFPLSFMNDVWSLIKGKDGNFYGGIYREGLFQFDYKTLTRKAIYVKGLHEKIEKDYYYGASSDEKGSLYFPTHNGIIKYDYKTAKRFNTGVSLFSIYDKQNKKIIFGQKNGFATIDENEKIEYIADNTEKLITKHPLYAIYTPNGDLWIGGLNQFAIYKFCEKKFINPNKVFNYYPKEGFFSAITDFRKNIWLGSYNGLWIYNLTSNTFSKVADETIKSYITSLRITKNNLLIVGTSYEIYVIDLFQYYLNKDAIEIKTYNYRNGFISQEVAQNGMVIDDNKIYIPSTTYTSIINISQINFVPNYFNVYVKSINNNGLSKEEDLLKTIRLPFGINNLRIEIEPIGFGLPTKSIFKYKLEGFNNDWSNWTNETVVYYNNISSKNYKFMVMIKNGSNIRNYEIKTNYLNIKVSLPFYKEPNFYAYAFFIFVLLSLLITFFTWRWYINKKAIEKRELKIKYLEINTLQAQINPHFIFNFLSSIQAIINKFEPRQANEYLIKFSRLIRAYMESSIKSSYFFSRKPVDNESTLKEEIDLLIDYIDLEKIKYDNDKIDYVIIVKDNAILHRTLPPMILQPFVENAIKHGVLPKLSKGKISIKFEEYNEGILCEIADNGIGITKSKEMRKDSISAHKSRGIDLINRRVEVLNQLGYNIKINYEEPLEGGTIVKIYII